MQLAASQRLLRSIGDDPEIARHTTMFYALRLDGPIDGKRCHEAFAATIGAHPSLSGWGGANESIGFASVASRDSDWTTMDLRHSPAKSLDLVATAERDRHIHSPFDRRSDRPVRGTFVHLSSDRSLLLLSFHHACIDGYGLDIFCGELSRRAAGAFSPSKSGPVPTVQILTDMSAPEVERGLTAWWSRRLGQLPDATFVSNGGARSVRLHRAHREIAHDLAITFRRWARQSRTTVNAALSVLAAVAIAAEGTSEFAFATLIANRRPGSGIGRGAEYDALLVRLCIGDDRCAADVAREAFDEVSAGIDRFLPLEKVMDIVAPGRRVKPRVVFQSDHHPLSLLRFPSVVSRPMVMLTGDVWPAASTSPATCLELAVKEIEAVAVAETTVFARSWGSDLGLTVFAPTSENASRIAARMERGIAILTSLADVTLGELRDGMDNAGENGAGPVLGEGATLVEHLSPIPITTGISLGVRRQQEALDVSR